MQHPRLLQLASLVSLRGVMATVSFMGVGGGWLGFWGAAIAQSAPIQETVGLESPAASSDDDGGDNDRALALEADGVANHPTDLEDQRQQAEALEQMGNRTAAIEAYGTLAAQYPQEPDLMRRWAELLSWDAQKPAALAAYEQLIERHPDFIPAYNGRAQVLSWMGRHRQATAAYEAILDRHPDNLQAQLGLAQVLSWRGQHQAALARYNAILETHPNSTTALAGQAQVTFWSGFIQQAITLYQEAIEQFPDDPDLRLGLAQVYESQQRIGDVVDILYPLTEVGHSEAQQFVRRLGASRMTTDFRLNSNNFGQSSEQVQQIIEFRLNYSDTLQSFRSDYQRFNQDNFDPLGNTLLQLGVSGQINRLSLQGAIGVDLFDRLPSVPNFRVDANLSPVSNLWLSGFVEQGAYKTNVEALESQITALRFGPDFYWQITETTGLYAMAQFGSYNDGNWEQQYLVKLEQQLAPFYGAVSFFSWSYRNDFQNGYFAPERLFNYTLEVGWENNITDALRCRVAGILGRQYLNGAIATANGFEAACSAALSPDFEVDLGYTYSTNINQIPTDQNFQQRSWYGQLRLLF